MTFVCTLVHFTLGTGMRHSHRQQSVVAITLTVFYWILRCNLCLLLCWAHRGHSDALVTSVRWWSLNCNLASAIGVCWWWHVPKSTSTIIIKCNTDLHCKDNQFESALIKVSCTCSTWAGVKTVQVWHNWNWLIGKKCSCLTGTTQWIGNFGLLIAFCDQTVMMANVCLAIKHR